MVEWVDRCTLQSENKKVREKVSERLRREGDANDEEVELTVESSLLELGGGVRVGD